MKSICSFVLVLLVVFSCQVKHLPVENGISRQLADWRVQQISDVEYDLYFNLPSAKTEAIQGEETIRFKLKSTAEDLQFDFKADSNAVQEITCNNRAVPVLQRDEHVVVPAEFLQNGENEVTVHFVAPDLSLNRNPEFLYTLFVPDRASTAFPCFDQPNLKARFTLSLTVDDEWEAVANGPVKEVVSGESEKLIRFQQTQPLPTYLFAFAAGKFEKIAREHNGREFTLYHRENKQEKLQNNVDDIFNLLFFSLDSIENYTNTAYPFPKYNLVAVPSFQYNGMEHPGAVLYRASSLFLEGNPTRNELLNRANLIAHETAHMWFGDLVTMPWFDEVWLKEVYANFIADKVVSPLFPEFNQDLLFLLAHNYSAYSVDRTDGANPVGQTLENMKDAGTLYGPIIYHKAPVIMKKLEQRIGKANLQKGLQQYLNKYAFGNAGWNELIALLDTDGSLKKWSDTWVYETGRPHLSVHEEDGEFVIDQTDDAGKSRNWQQTMEVVYAIGNSLSYQKVNIDGAKTRIRLGLSATSADWIYLNGEGNAYGFVEIGEKAKRFFIDHLNSIENEVTRAAIWTDLYENRMAGKLPDAEFLQAVINQLPSEKNAVIYERILVYLQDIFIYRASTEIVEAFQKPIESLVWNELEKQSSSRNALMNAAIRISTSPDALDRLYSIWQSEKSWAGYQPTKKQFTDLAFYMALQVPENANDILDKQEARQENADELERFRFVRQSLNPELEARDSFFQALLIPENREHEPWVNDALAFLNFPTREDESNKYIQPGLDILQEVQATGDIFFPQSWLDNLLRGHKSREAAEIVRQFLNQHPDYPETLRRKILQSVDFLLKENR